METPIQKTVMKANASIMPGRCSVWMSIFGPVAGWLRCRLDALRARAAGPTLQHALSGWLRCRCGALLVLLAGVATVPAANADALAWYYFNEDNNNAPSLAAVAAATITDTNRMWASNASAGAGLGQFGYGGTVANTHGYGTGANGTVGYVTPPSAFYARTSVLTPNESGAVAANDYLSFTLGPQPGSVLNFTGLSLWFNLTAGNTLTGSVVVRSSLDGFASDLARRTVLGSNANQFTLVTNSLGPAFSNLATQVEFRFYFYDDTSSTAYVVRLDDVGFFGAATNLPSNLPFLSVAATAPLATMSGTNNGAFTVQRSGDPSNALAFTYTMSGTAANGGDYQFLCGATNFPPGATNLLIPVIPIQNLQQGPVETAILTLNTNVSWLIAGANAATVTIWNTTNLASGSLLLEAESFTNAGGWVVDQQFVDLMGSPYLLAHGKGHPVADAATTALFPAPGVYYVWVRTKDWTAPLPDHPGSFTVSVGGVALAPVFGTTGQGWLWQNGGSVNIYSPNVEVRLHDLTGFDGRCDALFFTTDPGFVPPNDLAGLGPWRRAQLGEPDIPPSAGNFDLVVVGGGLAGSAAAIAAARQGLQVALIHDRPFPGGNASQDVRVPSLGVAKYSIVSQINTDNLGFCSDDFIQSDAHRLQVLLAETNIRIFTEWRAFAANTNGPHITSVDAKHIRTGQELRFTAPLFIDCTGDGWLGYWAGALYAMGREPYAEFHENLAPISGDAMTSGTTLGWDSYDTGHAVTFPAVPWATSVSHDYIPQVAGAWWWEYGLTLDTIYDAEEIRDHLLRAIYGAFSNLKQESMYLSQDLNFVAYIAGKRESRRLIGDYILTQADVLNPPGFADAVVTEGREIDLHYPQPGIYDFLSYAAFTPTSGYWIPFRCLYSTNIDNLMMAGRCLSASHVGLGSPRIMNTCGQMGVAAGTAAALCKAYWTTPRVIARQHAGELRGLLLLAPYTGGPPNAVSIIDVQDTNHVVITGAWTSSTSESGSYGSYYLHDGNTGKGAKSVMFRPNAPLGGLYQVWLHWTPGSNRATNVPVDINCSNGAFTAIVDQTANPGGWFRLGAFPFSLGTAGSVVIRTTGTSAYVIADAVALSADFPTDPRFAGQPWADDDGDGVCNYVEWLNGTNPEDPTSFLSVHLVGASGGPTLNFQALAGTSYSVQYRQSLASGSWTKLCDIASSNLTYEARLPIAPTNSALFYRIVTPKTSP